MKNAFLIGDKVYLRPLELDDAGHIIPWLNDPEINRTIHRSQPLNLHAEKEYLTRVSQSTDEVSLGIAHRQTDQLIGLTGLHQIDHISRHAGFGILIGVKDDWGKGYGTQATGLIVGHAFLTLNLNRVWLHVLAHNVRGIRAYEKVGFHREGILRQHLYKEGRYYDLHTMGVLRADWDALRNNTLRDDNDMSEV